MPLLPGSDHETIGKNIEELRRAGYPVKQAAAIAYHHAGESEDLVDRHTAGEEKKEPKEKKKPKESAHGPLGPDDE